MMLGTQATEYYSSYNIELIELMYFILTIVLIILSKQKKMYINVSCL